VRGLRSRRAPEVDERTTRVALQAVSLLVGYPSDELLEQLPVLRRVAAGLPDEAAQPLRRLCDHLGSAPLGRLQADYTDVFDLRRRCCLYLTYFSHGDTRQRGMALLRFSHAYRSAGADPVGGELPDHLSVVCEFAATADLALGLRLLHEHRAGLELLRAALVDAGSSYVDAVDVLRALLGEASAHDLDRARELAHSGPPEEDVGLEPFGPPELMGARR
jgi:nitrate reductase delta subunit